MSKNRLSVKLALKPARSLTLTLVGHEVEPPNGTNPYFWAMPNWLDFLALILEFVDIPVVLYLGSSGIRFGRASRPAPCPCPNPCPCP